MKVSVCVTTLNEERTIAGILEDLLQQTKKPDEIMVVDGGSGDKTVDIIRHWQRKDKRIKLLYEAGSIAHGRNTSVGLAKNEIIVTTDAGCRLKRDWLEKITNPFKNKDIDVVAGFYHMTGSVPIQRAAAPFLGVIPKRYDCDTFLPSARSLVFRKKVWKDVKGFSENQDRAGEDTLFVSEVLKKGYVIKRVKDAIVFWEVPKSIKELFWKFFYYARGDAQSKIWIHPTKKYWSHNIKIILVFFRYFVFGLLLMGFLGSRLPCSLPLIIYLLYFAWSIWKFRDIHTGWRVKLYFPLVQIISDIAVMSGFVSGVKVK